MKKIGCRPSKRSIYVTSPLELRQLFLGTSRLQADVYEVQPMLLLGLELLSLDYPSQISVTLSVWLWLSDGANSIVTVLLLGSG